MLFGLICILLWGLIPVVSTFGMQGLDEYQFLFWSSLISFISLGLLSFKAKQLKYLKAQNLKFWLYAGLMAMLGTFFYYFCLYQGYQYGTKIEVLSVQYTWPAWVIIFSLIVTKQGFYWHHALVILSGMACVLLVISKGDFRQLSVPNIEVLIWVMLGALAFALFSVLTARINMPALPLNTVFFGLATFASLALMLFKSSFALPNTDNIYALLANGVLVNGVSYYFWVQALRKTKAEHLSLLTFMTPLVSVIYLVVIFSEAFYPAYLLAFGLVSISGMVSVWQSKKLNKAG